ncbi:MAG TPA: DUF6599 family protein [Thermoanaerobaculia bacterium]|nr:DUF6599 family protein [Thermoanaerobaculia bacterium]
MIACGGDDKPRPAATAAAVVAQLDETSFTAIESPSLQFLPRGQETAGWQLQEDPIVIPGDRLTSYLDQGAAQFNQYDVIDATIGEYGAVGSDGFAIIEIFRFPDFVKAFGAYSTAKVGPIQFVPVENEAFRSTHTLHLWRGPFYVRVIGGGAHAEGGGLLQIVQFVAQRMPAAPSKPAVFEFFPTETRVPNSERFSADKGFGYEVLGNSFQASFNIGGDIMEGLIIPAADKQAAVRILDAYREMYVANGKLLDPIPNLGEDNFTAEDRFMGRAVAFRIDRFVIAFNGYKERQKLVNLAIATDRRILNSIRRQLTAADRR